MEWNGISYSCQKVKEYVRVALSHLLFLPIVQHHEIVVERTLSSFRLEYPSFGFMLWEEEKQLPSVVSHMPKD